MNNPLDRELCVHYEHCGGCSQQTLDYKLQLKQKEEKVKLLLEKKGISSYQYQGIVPSPRIYEYRNKMEFSFGDLEKGGILQLGMHPRGKRFDVVTVDSCQLVDEDFHKILTTILEYFRNQGFRRYHIKRREGYLRNLVVRKGLKTGEIQINLVTTSSRNHNYNNLTSRLTELDYQGKLVGFLQTINDSYSDAVQCDQLIIHYGRDYFFEKIFDLRFKIMPFSFFQVNTLAAEKLFEIVLDYLDDRSDLNIFDLYCGTGTISQLVAKKAARVTGIEIEEEAVQMARENTELNGIENCHFLAGDVFERIGDTDLKPDVIIVDPPRPGIHPSALTRIAAFKSPQIIYVSCNPQSLARDLVELEREGYEIKKLRCVDMFPHTSHIETCSLLERV